MVMMVVMSIQAGCTGYDDGYDDCYDQLPQSQVIMMVMMNPIFLMMIMIDGYFTMVALTMVLISCSYALRVRLKNSR